MDTRVPDSSVRKEARRHLVFGKTQGFAEHELQGLQFWQDADPAVKLDAIIQLIEDSWYLRGENGPPPRLDRSTHGVLELGR